VADDGASRVYVAVTSDDSVQSVSAADNNSTLGGAWATAPAKKPQALALDPRGERRLFVAGVNGKLVTLAAGDGQRIGINDLPTGVTQMAFDATLDRLYCPGGSGKLAVFDTRGNFLRLLGEITTVRGAKSIAIDPATHAVWLAYTEGGKCFARKFVP
jgi:DNA-binding beta-propeller fold protein YncE